MDSHRKKPLCEIDNPNASKLGLATVNHGFLYDRMLLEHSKYDFWTGQRSESRMRKIKVQILQNNELMISYFC